MIMDARDQEIYLVLIRGTSYILWWGTVCHVAYTYVYVDLSKCTVKKIIAKNPS